MKRGKEQNHCRCDSFTIEWLNERIARTIKEQEAGVEGEGGGEDEGGEGDAVGDQDDWEISIATRADNSELNSRGFV